MPVVYRTLTDYGSGAGPKPKDAAPLVVAPEPLSACGRTRSIIAGQRRPSPTDDEMYEFLIGFARRGERAPTLSEIETRIGHGGDRVLRRLVRVGRISIEIGMRNYRVIIFVGTLLETLRPKTFRAYRRCDNMGDWWRENGSWRPYAGKGLRR